jgi:phenylacetic acid degradation operon negative regulatory protein
MLQSKIVASKGRDIGGPVATLDARSLALSALLGTHPPTLPGRALVALAELFDIAPGTMRTALSRMVANGELAGDDGRYTLRGVLLDRQRAQDLGRRPPVAGGRDEWHVLVALDEQRPLTERRRVRRIMADHRFAELRAGVWARPANLDAPAIDGWLATTGPITGLAATELAARLWDLAALDVAASALCADLATHAPAIATHSPDAIPATFHVAASTVRFLRTDPLLPPSLLPPNWPLDTLRTTYDAVERDLHTALRAFFRRCER